MAGLREIQNRIKSIQDTRKITNAMYMISSTKMRKAKQDLENTEPYFYTLQSMMDRMLRHLPDVSHMYFEKEEKEEPAPETLCPFCKMPIDPAATKCPHCTSDIPKDSH